jgi:hypothetical protein
MTKPKLWLTVALESGIFWPTTETIVSYDGHDFLLRPETDHDAPSVALGYDAPMDDAAALLLIRRFLSALSWIEGGYLRERFTFGTGGAPGRVSKSPGARMINPFFRADYLPAPTDARSRLCLALYREALNVNSVPFQFLGFYKIINVLQERGAEQRAWINATIPKITDYRASERIREIQRSESDVAAYLYESGRCAVAHAFAEPVVDPDDPKDTARLIQDLPVIQALAEFVIDRELGVQSIDTYRSEHLYQLAGFRDLFGKELVAHLKSGTRVELNAIPSFPSLSFRVRSHEKFATFEDMEPQVMQVNEGCIWVRCRSKTGLVTVVLGLDFPREFLLFHISRHIRIVDDGSASAMQHALDDNRFFKAMITNGELEIWDADRQVLLGRDDPLIPVNVDIGRTVDGLDQRNAGFKAVLELRLALEKKREITDSQSVERSDRK